MRSLLTHRVFRQIIQNELQSSTQSWYRRPTQCSRWQPNGVSLAVPRRFLFGFSRNRKTRRKAKPAEYEPGYEAMLELSNRLKIGVRAQPPTELGQAFVNFFISKQKDQSPLEATQCQHVLAAFEHLQRLAIDDGNVELTSEEIRLGLHALKRPFTLHEGKPHNRLAKALFAELQNRWGSLAENPTPMAGNNQDLIPFIQIMARSGDTLYARELVERHWNDCLEHEPRSLWSRLLKGFIREYNFEEVENTVNMMQKYSVPFDSTAHEIIVSGFALHKEDIELTKAWYSHPIIGGSPPTALADRSVLKLCIKKMELTWGDTIFKSLLKHNPGDEVTWNIIFQWSAVKGKSVDEIEQMMQVMVRRSSEEGNHLQPDISIINGLIKLANSKNDPYTAERYVALGQRLGLQPNARTYLLQLDYRLKVGDLGGARTAYARLQSEEVPQNQDLPLINKLIVALCVEKLQNYESIMAIVDDLSERKARLESHTVAALSLLHLQRNEMDDLTDLLNTYVFHYGLEQRASVRDVLLRHCLDSSTPTSRAWETYNILRQIFTETDIPTRTTLMKNFFARNRPDMATLVFGHMRQQEIKSRRPTVATYAQCLASLGRAGDLESLANVHNMIKLDSEIEPSTQLYNGLMLGYSGCGNTRRALEFWDDIIYSREGPSYASIQIAFQVCERSAGDGERIARDIWSKLQRFEIEVTREIYAAYVGALAGHGLFDECVNLIDNVETKLAHKPDALLIGTLYNAIPGSEDKARVKEWAWAAYPMAYEELLKLGQYTVGKIDEEGEDDPWAPKDTFFDIRAIGRDVDP